MSENVAEEEEETSAPRASSVARVVAIIDALARGNGEATGVRELAARLGLSRSVVHRMLVGLAEGGVAESLPSGRYKPGVLMLSWAALLHREDALLGIGRAVLADVVADVGETAFLTVYAPGSHFATLVATHHTPNPLRYQLNPGTRVPLHAGGSGKSILALLPDSVIDELPMEKFSDTTIVDRAQLRRELRQGARVGYAVGRGDVNPDSSGVGAAFEIDGQVAGSICINVPTIRLKKSLVPDLGARVRDAATVMTNLLSHRTESAG